MPVSFKYGAIFSILQLECMYEEAGVDIVSTK